MKPRCALVLSTFRPVVGGYQRQLEAVFAEMQFARGWHVEVLTRRQVGSPDREMIAGLHVARGGGRGPTFAGWAFARLLASAPDVVVSAQLGSAAATSVSYSRVRSTPTVLRLAGSEDPTTVVARFIRGLATHAHVVAPSQHQLGRLRDAGWTQPALVIPNGVSVPPKRQFGGSFLWYGRDTAAKNPRDFQRLVEVSADVQFCALGDATLHPRPNLETLGWVADAADALTHARGFVSTSRSEGSPNVALQALAAGLPVIAFDIPAYRELRDAYPGHVILVPFGDVQGLAAALRAAPSDLPAARVPSVHRAAELWDRFLRELL